MSSARCTRHFPSQIRLSTLLHIKQTAVHRITSGRHIMNINISVTACLYLFRVHEKFLIEFLVQFIKDQTSFGRNQSTSVLAFSLSPMYMIDWLFCIDIIQHLYKILLIVTIIA